MALVPYEQLPRQPLFPLMLHSIGVSATLNLYARLLTSKSDLAILRGAVYKYVSSGLFEDWHPDFLQILVMDKL